MNRTRTFLLLVLAVAGLTGAAFGVWYLLRPPPPLPENWNKTSNAVHNLPVFLVPVATGTAEDRRPAPEVWQNLFTGMTADLTTRTLLQKLYGDLRTDLVVDATVPTDPPGQGYAVVLRVNSQQPGETDPAKIARQVGGRGDVNQNCMLGRLDLSRVSWIKISPEHAPKLSSILDHQSDDFKVLLLATNEYLLRKQAGWWIINGKGVSAGSIKMPPGSPAELRTGLDREIEEYLRSVRQVR